jgi:DNA-binding MarR family transcriptional regulator
MEGRGWIHRLRAPGDGRSRLVELTPAGQALAAEIAERRSRRLALLLEHIPPPDRATVLKSLDLLVEAARDSQT